jgi:hypothetical protein
MVGINIVKSYLLSKENNTAPLINVILVGAIALVIDWAITMLWLKVTALLLSVAFTIKVASGIWFILKLLVWNLRGSSK